MYNQISKDQKGPSQKCSQLFWKIHPKNGPLIDWLIDCYLHIYNIQENVLAIHSIEKKHIIYRIFFFLFMCVFFSSLLWRETKAYTKILNLFYFKKKILQKLIIKTWKSDNFLFLEIIPFEFILNIIQLIKISGLFLL